MQQLYLKSNLSSKSEEKYTAIENLYNVWFMGRTSSRQLIIIKLSNLNIIIIEKQRKLDIEKKHL